MREAWEQQKNPLYVWDAIQMCLLPQDVDPKEATIPETLPDWCMLYLARVAYEIWMLVNQGLPSPNPFHRGRPSPERDGLTPLQCVERLPAILGLSRPGWNAFERLQAEREREMDAVFAHGLTMLGVTSSAAQERIADARGIEELTTVAKRISRGRRAVSLQTAIWLAMVEEVMAKSKRRKAG